MTRADNTANIIPAVLAALLILAVCMLAGCSGGRESSETAEQQTAQQQETAGTAESGPGGSARPVWADMKPSGSIPLEYAEAFTADLYEGGLVLVCMGDDRFLLLPGDAEAPEGLDADITIVRSPAQRIYVASSSAMDLFYQCGGIGSVGMTATDSTGWDVPYIRDLVDAGDVVYAGRYSAPDFEYLLSEGCDLVIENTMIYHTPEIKEKLEKLGIPVIVERSSTEDHPLGRLEWIKLYGLLTGRYEEAEAYFNEKVRQLSEVLTGEQTGKTVAFFFINSSGAAIIRKSTDYIPKMIEMAGGTYIFSAEAGEDNALSTTTMQMEAFYNGAVNADIIIYNSTIDGEIYTIGELLEKSSLLADFKAVKEGRVWCTGQNMFQQTSCISDMICDMYEIISGKADGLDELTYLHRVK